MNRSVKPRLYLRTHGGSEIGFGHISRCVAIAEELDASYGIRADFIVNNDPVARSFLTRLGWRSIILNERATVEEQVQCIVGGLTGNPAVACLIDMKTDVSGEIHSWRECNGHVVLMDNKTPARLFAHANIYPSIFSNHVALDWSGYDGSVVGGTEWIPLAKRFVSARLSCPPIDRRCYILVTMGGADPNNLTEKVLQSLVHIEDIAVRVVLGFSFREKRVIREIVSKFNRSIEIIENSHQMEKLMGEAGLAITALGTSIYELACLGVPTVVISNYEDDKDDERELGKSGWVVPLGYHEKVSEMKIASSIEELWHDLPKRSEMSRRASHVVDGVGASRICKELYNHVSTDFLKQ